MKRFLDDFEACCTAALPHRPSARDSDDEPAQAAVPRAAAPSGGDRKRLRGAAGLEADVYGVDLSVERWRGMRMGAFEPKPIEVIHEELDAEDDPADEEACSL